VEDVTGMDLLGISAIKANVCEECASVLKAAQKKRSKRKSTRKEAEQHPDVADMVDDEAVDDAEPEEEEEEEKKKKENQSLLHRGCLGFCGFATLAKSLLIYLG